MLIPDLVTELQDLRHLEWSRIRNSSGTAGSYLKSYGIIDGNKIYYKLSCFDSINGIIGHECVNELIADRLLTILGVEHLHYQLIHAQVNVSGTLYDTWLSASEDFKAPGESKLALDSYYDLEKKTDESPLAFCIRQGWSSYIYEMLIIDYLLLNRDRHGTNIEVLKKRRSSSVRLAPLFDHGLSLLYSCHTEEDVNRFDIAADLPVQCFVGSRSALQNLQLIPQGKHPSLRPLEERDRTVLLAGLEHVLPTIYLDKIWEMIWNRWKTYETICHQR